LAAARAGVVMMATAVKSAVAWVVGFAGPILASIAAVVGGIMPMLIVFGVIIGAIVGLGVVASAFGVNWQKLWESVVDFARRALQWLADRIGDFLNFLKQIPFLGDLFKNIGDKMGEWGRGIGDGLGAARDSLGKLIEDAKKGLPGLMEQFGLALPDLKAYDEEIKKLEEDQKKAREEAAKLEEEIRRMVQNPSGEGLGYPDVEADAESSADKLKAYIASLRYLLGEIPGMTRELIEYLAELANEAPERFDSLVKAIRASRDEIEEMRRQKEALLATTIQLEAVERNIAHIEHSIGTLDLQIQQVQIGYQQRLLGLKIKQMRLDEQMYQHRRRIADLEHQIMLAQRENLDLAIQRTQIEIDILPYKQEIEDIERAITEVTDKRLKLAMREQELIAEQTKDNIESQLKAVEKQLDAAWGAQNVAEILRLEGIKEGLTDQQSSAEDALDAIQQQQRAQQRADELATIALEKEKLALEELLKPYEARLIAIERITDAEKLRADLTVLGLEKEKRALEDLLYPLELQAEELGHIQDQIELEIAIATEQFERQKIQYQQQLIAEQLRRADLQATKTAQEEVFESLVLKFVEALTASGVFTRDEAIEVAKRLGMWDSQIMKMAETVTSFNNVRDSANGIRDAINAIPKNVTITITTVHKTVNDTTAGYSDVGASAPRENSYTVDHAYQAGGIVPGNGSAPVPVLAHPGEVFLGTEQHIPATVLRAAVQRLAQVGAGGTVINNSYNVSAVYEKRQEPATVAMDIRAIIGAAKR
jgi:hypothetical protein